jgi:hypothetical protein
MAFRLVIFGRTKVYVGKSTDNKPVIRGVPSGSLFIEEDTGKVYVFNGSSWILRNPTYLFSTVVVTTNINNNTFIAPSGLETAPDTTEANRRIIVPAGTIGLLRVSLATAPGNGNSRTFTVFKNGTSTPLEVTISNTETSGSNISSFISTDDNDTISIKHTTSGSPTATTKAYLSLAFLEA